MVRNSSLPRRSLFLTLVVVMVIFASMMTAEGAATRGAETEAQGERKLPDKAAGGRRRDYLDDDEFPMKKKSASEKKRFREKRKAVRESLQNKTDSSKKRFRQEKMGERKRMKAERDQRRAELEEDEGIEL